MLIKDEILELVEKYKQLVNTQDRELFDEVFVKNNQCNLIAITKHFNGRESIYNDFLLGGIQKNYRFIELISDEVDVYEINDQLVNIVFKYHTRNIFEIIGKFVYYIITRLKSQYWFFMCCLFLKFFEC